MSLKEPVNRGDWVRATSETGSVIEGQSTEDKDTFGYSAMVIAIQGDHGDKLQEITINVNFWDVERLRHNLLTGVTR